jgi:hypothetical protein
VSASLLNRQFGGVSRPGIPALTRDPIAHDGRRAAGIRRTAESRLDAQYRSRDEEPSSRLTTVSVEEMMSF